MNCGALAQEKIESSPVPLEILKLKWEKTARLPRNFDPSVIPTGSGSGFSDPARSISSATAPASAGGVPATQDNPYVAFPAVPNRLPVYYLYSIKIRNSSAKTIAGIAWDYIFIDPNSNKELGRHQFLSYEKVSPDKQVTFRGQMRSPPVRLVQSPPQKTRKLTEKAMIQCVLYEDSTIWRDPLSRPGICEFLASKRSTIKRKHNS